MTKASAFGEIGNKSQRIEIELPQAVYNLIRGIGLMNQHEAEEKFVKLFCEACVRSDFEANLLATADNLLVDVEFIERTMKAWKVGWE